MESRRRIDGTQLTSKTERFMSNDTNLIYGLTSFSSRTRYRPLCEWITCQSWSAFHSHSLFDSERWGNELPEVLIACVSRRIDSYPIYHVQISWIFLLVVRSICWIEGRRCLKRLLRLTSVELVWRSASSTFLTSSSSSLSFRQTRSLSTFTSKTTREGWWRPHLWSIHLACFLSTSSICVPEKRNGKQKVIM